MKIAQLLKAGANVKILLADVHAFLDSKRPAPWLMTLRLKSDSFSQDLKAPIELVEYRARYYRFAITALLKACNVPVEKLEFVLGSSYQVRRISGVAGVAGFRSIDSETAFRQVYDGHIQGLLDHFHSRQRQGWQ